MRRRNDEARPARGMARWAWLALAGSSLAVAVVALFVPGLPSTEFVLLAAWAATRGSPRLAAWIERHRLFGPMLYNWRNGRAVSRRAKVTATLSMSACVAIMAMSVDDRRWVIAAALAMACGACWMWGRPEKPEAPEAPVTPVTPGRV
ncbi:YbaN family protein [Cupriavidus sp. 30B13]|uniref:YbaN family protein n=1 Tax=Cupriavidus sp. 30B13 TaxID=3384241 RepID=UPI003B8F6626